MMAKESILEVRTKIKETPVMGSGWKITTTVAVF